MKKIFSLLLCAAMLFSLAACGTTGETPAEQQAAEPTAAEVYTQAAAALDESDVLSLQNDITLLTTAGADSFK